MKKILFIAFLGLVTMNVNAINDTIPKVPPDSLQLTYKQVYSDIKSGISAIADGLKVGSEHVYEVLVKQQVVQAWTWLLLLMISFVLIIPFFKIGNLVRKGTENFYDKEFPRAAYYIVLGGCIFSFIIVSVCKLDIIIGGFINPEYGAIHEILHVIK